MVEPIVTDSSPLIALHQIGQLELLPRFFDSVFIPPDVATEIASVQPRPEWLEVITPSQPIGSQILRASLGPGESAAISLALEINASLVILDDRPARRLAQTLGLSVIGTLGLLLAAKRRGFVTLLKPLLDELRVHNFYVADILYETVLRDAGE